MKHAVRRDTGRKVRASAKALWQNVIAIVHEKQRISSAVVV